MTLQPGLMLLIYLISENYLKEDANKQANELYKKSAQ